MFPLPEMRGKRLGSAILRQIEDAAPRRGISRLVLRTGRSPRLRGPPGRVYLSAAGFPPAVPARIILIPAIPGSTKKKLA